MSDKKSVRRSVRVIATRDLMKATGGSRTAANEEIVLGFLPQGPRPHRPVLGFFPSPRKPVLGFMPSHKGHPTLGFVPTKK